MSVMDKNQIIQQLTMYFKVGLKPLPLFRFQIDTNRINARGGLVYMNQLESWADNGTITLHFSSTVLNEIQKPGIGHAREQQISRRISGELFTTGFPEDEQRQPFEKIENILFPNGCKKDESKMNYVRIVFHAYKYHYILITDEGDSKSQPEGILGNAAALSALSIKVMRDSEAVDMVRCKIDKLNDYIQIYSEQTGTQLELFD
jgi:hypothetical protein